MTAVIRPLSPRWQARQKSSGRRHAFPCARAAGGGNDRHLALRVPPCRRGRRQSARSHPRIPGAGDDPASFARPRHPRSTDLREAVPRLPRQGRRRRRRGRLSSLPEASRLHERPVPPGLHLGQRAHRRGPARAPRPARRSRMPWCSRNGVPCAASAGSTSSERRVDGRAERSRPAASGRPGGFWTSTRRRQEPSSGRSVFQTVSATRLWPSALGWMPSARFRAGTPATSSSRNGTSATWFFRASSG